MTTPAETRRPMSVGGNSTSNVMRRSSDAGAGQRYGDWEREGSKDGAGGGGKLRKRFGSLRVK